MSAPLVTPGLDHIALNVPDLDAQVDRLIDEFGWVVESRMPFFAVLSDPITGLKLELGRSEDTSVHFRHLGYKADDLEGAHAELVAAGMSTIDAPHRRDFARMSTSYLEQAGGLEVQLVKYD